MGRRRQIESIATITRVSGQPDFELEVPYNEEFLARLKVLVPGSHRAWIANKKIWKIFNTYESKVYSLCEEFFDEVEHDLKKDFVRNSTMSRVSFPGQPVEEANPWKEFLLFLPRQIALNAYKEGMKIHHPDHGGDPEKFKKLREIWIEIEKEII